MLLDVIVDWTVESGGSGGAVMHVQGVRACGVDVMHELFHCLFQNLWLFLF